MNESQKNAVSRMNELGANGQCFAFVIDFDFTTPLIFDSIYNRNKEQEENSKFSIRKMVQEYLNVIK